MTKMRISTKFVEWMKTIYGEKLTVHRGKVHDYIGMDMNWSKDGKVTISMIKYLYQVLYEFIEQNS